MVMRLSSKQLFMGSIPIKPEIRMKKNKKLLAPLSIAPSTQPLVGQSKKGTSMGPLKLALKTTEQK